MVADEPGRARGRGDGGRWSRRGCKRRWQVVARERADARRGPRRATRRVRV